MPIKTTLVKINRNAGMEHHRGELADKAVLDKRVCPGCGAEQSYDEAVFVTKCRFDMGKRTTQKKLQSIRYITRLVSALVTVDT
ncbi:hypothetical protein Esi_0986_0002 [Ectocarpus siliculosus]|uniref:Uncharacterized protein n=1 Tax=Ectocarpus siliculosus TaxID=2880 RepID=D7G9I9_ECTSI|nr:hypothetical protein Esi_0986_0002 [Ectocarpus siliculosus]|eukprot:CBJ34099.1 hypothetical protein Esi_0986_0002 [Ectocarpus siliculosus]